MLVLSRKQGQTIHIGNNIVITVVRVEGHRVRLGLAAPDHVSIKRGELCEFDDYDFSDLETLTAERSTVPDRPVSTTK